MANRFQKSLLNKDEFTVSLEIVAGRGSFEKAQENAVKTASWAGKDPRISAVSITDSPGGRPGIDPAFMALEMKEYGVEPMIHYTLKDKNRLNIESELYGYDRMGLHNLLIMTGDFPKKGYFSGNGKPVFDLDPVHTLQMISAMNEGMALPKGHSLKKTDFFAGCVVTPFKNVEAEIVTEYMKLEKKIAAGTRFVISQVGYDMRKFDELLKVCRSLNPQVPLIGNIFILDKKLAELIHLHRFTGCTIPEKLYQRILSEDGDGQKSGLQRAAKMFAIMKGLGYDGVHLGGENLTREDVDFVVCRGTELAVDWESLLKEFEGFDDGASYYYHRDDSNGLNTSEKNDLGALPVEAHLSWKYKTIRKLHESIFEKKGFLSKSATALGRRSAKGKFCRKVEKSLRAGILNCRDCGDCALPFTDFICPMTQCPKEQRNGPCGGSRNGYCELYPNKRPCLYVTAYNRLKAQHKTELLRVMVDPPSCGLYGTSEFHNYFTGKDAYSKWKERN